ncbi:hypothetical protein VNO77_31632 [Canavalia gladiata]|uniref:Uncharacterized protein n=1 Tax=Canavalia gladiata TaxID=3824 RepID=A0AAN9KP21_CANGL
MHYAEAMFRPGSAQRFTCSGLPFPTESWKLEGYHSLSNLHIIGPEANVITDHKMTIPTVSCVLMHLTSTYLSLSIGAQEKENLQDACNEEMSSRRRLHEIFERQVER